MLDWKALTTEQRVEFVTSLWAEGRSATQISRMFSGCTKNAVIGTVHRYGITRPAAMKPRRAKIEPKPKPVKPPKPKIAPQPRGPLQIIPDREPLPGVEPISILDLPGRPGIRCRFPVVGGYCGAECGEHTYCPKHRAIAYIPALPKPRPPRGAYFGTTRL